jgi:hypothetical protein
MKSEKNQNNNNDKIKLLTSLKKYAKAIHQSPKKFDKWLTSQISQLPEKRVKVLLIVTVAILIPSMMLAFYMGIKDITNGPALKMQFITAPSIPRKHASPSLQLSGHEIEKLQACRKYLDSLKNNKEGIAIFDSIIKQRPHLLDSLAYIELIYGINKIK